MDSKKQEMEDEDDLAETVFVVQASLAELDAEDRGMLFEDYRAQIQTAKRSLSSEASA